MHIDAREPHSIILKRATPVSGSTMYTICKSGTMM